MMFAAAGVITEKFLGIDNRVAIAVVKAALACGGGPAIIGIWKSFDPSRA
jgi:hypothetical protein